MKSARANITIERRGRKGTQHFFAAFAAFAAFAFQGCVSSRTHS